MQQPVPVISRRLGVEYTRLSIAPKMTRHAETHFGWKEDSHRVVPNEDERDGNTWGGGEPRESTRAEACLHVPALACHEHVDMRAASGVEMCRLLYTFRIFKDLLLLLLLLLMEL